MSARRSRPRKIGSGDPHRGHSVPVVNPVSERSCKFLQGVASLQHGRGTGTCCPSRPSAPGNRVGYRSPKRRKPLCSVPHQEDHLRRTGAEPAVHPWHDQHPHRWHLRFEIAECAGADPAVATRGRSRLQREDAEQGAEGAADSGDRAIDQKDQGATAPWRNRVVNRVPHGRPEADGISRRSIPA